MNKYKTIHLFLFSLFFWSNPSMAIEEPKYQVLLIDGAFEIRRYEPMLIAQTWAEGDMDEASNKGFRRIADFIFGNNQPVNTHDNAKIAMTAPVTVEPPSTKIAMTAPVTVEPNSADVPLPQANRWRIHFVMPNQYTLDNIPKPKNSEIFLKEVPAKYFAVHRYSGLNTLSRVQEKTEQTLHWAKQKSLNIHGTPQLARYDPPWTLPMFRRNEILLEITPP